MPRPFIATLAVLAAGLLLTACSSTTTTRAAKPVDASVTSCGAGWTPTVAGRQHIELRNTDSRGGEAQLIAPATGAVYADVEPLGPGTTTSVDVSLSAGHYAWRCLMEDEGAVDGPDVSLTGAAQGTTPGVRPVSQADLVPATKAYEHYVSGQLPHLADAVRRLASDLDDRTTARRDWLTAHVEYERLGAAYDAFGDLDADINGLPSGLADGVHDPHWTGFHRIEYGLWHGESAASLAPIVGQLRRSVATLQHQFATTQIDPGEIAIRAHEISENALQFELTGRTDFGSDSAGATIRANLDGTTVVLRIIHALIAPRYPALTATRTQLRQTIADVATHARPEILDADMSELCELLAPIAAILEPRRTS